MYDLQRSNTLNYLCKNKIAFLGKRRGFNPAPWDEAVHTEHVKLQPLASYPPRVAHTSRCSAYVTFTVGQHDNLGHWEAHTLIKKYPLQQSS